LPTLRWALKYEENKEKYHPVTFVEMCGIGNEKVKKSFY